MNLQNISVNVPYEKKQKNRLKGGKALPLELNPLCNSLLFY